MKVTELPLEGLKLIEPNVFGDKSLFFMETWQAERYREHGIDVEFVQDNLSRPSKGVPRGLHIQNPHAQDKLVQCLEGEVFDVAVDIRRGSPTFGRWHGEHLGSHNRKQMWVPKDFAHGYLVLSESSLFCYKCTCEYVKESEHALAWNDPEVEIRWPQISAPLQISEKDHLAMRCNNLTDHYPG